MWRRVEGGTKGGGETGGVLAQYDGAARMGVEWYVSVM